MKFSFNFQSRKYECWIHSVALFRPELVSDGIQTDDLPQLKKETHQYSTQEQQTEPNEEELSTKIEELNNALKVFEVIF